MADKEAQLDPRLRKRMLVFYFAGAVNLALGLYVLVAGGGYLGHGTALVVALFFLVFAAVDFYFPNAMKKRWAAAQQQLAAQKREQGETRRES